MTVFTIGHSTRSIDELIALLQAAGVTCLVDVRSVPRSRTNPQFNTDTLPAGLAPAGILYRHLPALGGLRGPRKDGAASPNTLWRAGGFRNYADYAMTPGFRGGLDALLALARDRVCAVMCAEAVWWRCHRRIIADYLLAADVPVRHILGPGKTDPAAITPGARLEPDGTIVYAGPPAEADGPQGRLL